MLCRVRTKGGRLCGAARHSSAGESARAAVRPAQGIACRLLQLLLCMRCWAGWPCTQGVFAAGKQGAAGRSWVGRHWSGG